MLGLVAAGKEKRKGVPHEHYHTRSNYGTHSGRLLVEADAGATPSR